jgi:hypothetical protein
MVMNSRATQLLLASIAVLLVLHLFAEHGPMDAHAQATPIHEVVRARLIELVSADGQVVAQLHTGEDGGGQLRLRNGKGVVAVKLGASRDGSALILMDDQAEPAVWLTASAGGTKVTLSQRGKRQRVLEP